MAGRPKRRQIAILFDAFIDPLDRPAVGQLAQPLGPTATVHVRRGAPFGIADLALWNPPHWHGMALFGYLLVTAIVIRTLSSLFEVPSSALSAEFSPAEQRSVLLSLSLLRLAGSAG